MAKFYGQVDGISKTSATRRGSASSGLKVTAQSYEGSIITRLLIDSNNGDTRVKIELAMDKSASSGDLMFNGTFEELKALFELGKDIEMGKVSITRHKNQKQ